MLEFIKAVLEDMRLSALALLGGVDGDYHERVLAWRDDEAEVLIGQRRQLRAALFEIGLAARRIQNAAVL